MDNQIVRTATVNRVTKETRIRCTLCLDGSGQYDINTGIGFFDHMLSGFARHGLFDLTLTCEGDLEVDSHHTIEDCGIVLGECIRQAKKKKKAQSDLAFTVPVIGQMDTEMVKEFFYSVSYAGMMNLHFKQFTGQNNHHIAECAFKAFGKALDMAVMHEPRMGDAVWSTKGVL